MSKLVELYLKEIKEKRMSVEDVPPKLQDSVQKELKNIADGGE